ncbi:hypothetical protein NDU88_000869 [Pleurodeles waltl]|uniref:Retrotransposon gag domain-containing protein n=1 Tax=Pleurodeles waltl TaxID=8319 RepID=A0AAV7S869_PLEWA|nr:hypothetical protein NDU88_000869 [Pleurodeles waltl]
MEEVDVGDHQDDLEKMLAHMRAEALRRGKDWLRAKMEERVVDGDVPQVSDQNLTTREDASGPGSEEDTTHKANKRQRTEGKPAKKVAKRSRGANRPTSAPATVEAPESNKIQLEGLDLTVSDKKDEDRRERKKVRKERNFENWLDAFRIMACVIVEKFPRRAVDLWLYESKIHEAYRQFPGDAWLEYDKRFTLKMQAHPKMEWNEEDVSNYIHKMMVPKEVRSRVERGDQPFRNTYHKGKHENLKSFHRFKPWHSGKGQGDKGAQAICWKF